MRPFRRLLLLLGLALAAPLPGHAAGEVAKSLEIGDYRIDFIADPDAPVMPFTAALRVTRHGREVYGAPFLTRLDTLEIPPGGRNSVFPAEPGSDLTGDGRPDLALLSFSGGAHCCFTLEIFRLQPDFARIARIEGENSPPQLLPRAAGRGYLVELVDWTFAYWHAPFAASPAPLVRLAWNGEAFAADPALMRSPPLSDNDLDRKVDALAAELAAAGKAVPSLWKEMLELLYGGNGEQAFALLARSWPEGLGGREAFLLQFGAQLGLSAYYPALVALNGWEDF